MIPLLRPQMGEEEVQAIREVIYSGWIGMGPKVEEFEAAFARFTGKKYAVAMNSCTAALHLALEALGVGPGDEVICPALTFISTALAARYCGAEPRFADIDPLTLCMDPRDVEVRTTRFTRAIVPVHFAGATAPLAPYDPEILVEDCAHLGGGKPGSGRLQCWSFHAVKNIACGDGGMVTTDELELAETVRRRRWCGINRSTWERARRRYGWDYDIQEVGYKCHMNDLQAALGLVQLNRIEAMNARRAQVAAEYLRGLSGLEWLTLPDGRNQSWHLFIVRTAGRDRLVDHLLARGISAGVHYKPLTHYPIFESIPLPVTDSVWPTLVTLPCHPALTDAEVEYIIETVRAFDPGAGADLSDSPAAVGAQTGR
jgi:perosamine synthetase